MDFSESDVNIYQRATNLLPNVSNLLPNVSNLLPTETIRPSIAHSSNQPEPSVVMPVPVIKPVKFDPNSLYYDMSGKKRMLIFNHSTYEAGGFYGLKPPKDRIGTDRDVSSLYLLFKRLGFDVSPYHNKRHQEIKNIVTQECAQDHKGTSCVAVVIMTHGDKGQILCAYDRTYYLSEILNIFANGHDTLVNKPKLFFIQATEFDPSTHQTNNDLPPNSHTDCELNLNPGPSTKPHDSNYEACRGSLVDAGRLTHHDHYGKKLLHVPKHIDFLIARSTVENYRAWKDKWGSWYIQELCTITESHHKELDILQILTLVTRTVAYKYKTYTFEPDLDEKKATPETKFTLTKLLKF